MTMTTQIKTHYKGKNAQSFNGMGVRKDIAMIKIRSLVDTQSDYYLSRNETFIDFSINAIFDASIDVVLITLNLRGNPVSRKYTIHA